MQEPGRFDLALEVVGRLARGEKVSFQEKFAAARLILMGESRKDRKAREKSLEKNPMEFETDFREVDDPRFFNESFGIDDLKSGLFLGECGIAFNEEASCLEVWLFDKNDIKTQTVAYYFGEANKPQGEEAKKYSNIYDLTQEKATFGAVVTATLQVSVKFEEVVFESPADVQSGKNKIKKFKVKLVASQNLVVS